MRYKRTFLITAIVLFVAVGCGPKDAPRKRNLQSVAFETTRRQTVIRTIGLLGTVEGERQATAMSKITGKITNIARPEGSWVNEDDAIAFVVNDIPGMDYQPGPVRAPIAGYVGRVYVQVGQTVAPGVPVAVVANYVNRVTVKARISDQDLRFVKTGAPATISVTAFPDTVFSGRVTVVPPVLDQLSRTAAVELSVTNTDRKLVPGMACGVQLMLEQKTDVVALPRAALFTNGYTRVAVLEDSIARFRNITTGLVGDQLIEVTSGLQPGERVITTGKERIEDGGKVIPIEVGQR